MADAGKKIFSHFPDDFKEYMYKELNCRLAKNLCAGVFWSREDDGPQRPSTLPDGDISNLNKIIRHFLHKIMLRWSYGPVLFQLWAPITTEEGRSFLTTRNQPFSLISFFDPLRFEGLCGYRMICMDSKFDIDLDGGKTCEQHLPARVFNHQFPESTPNVEFYSITEYPQRDDALRCGVRQSLAFPVFQSSTQRCVGVIEVVKPAGNLRLLICNKYFQYGIYEDFEKFGLKCSVLFDHEDMKLDEDENEAHTIALDEIKNAYTIALDEIKNAHTIALDDIKNVLKMVCDVHDLPLAQAWVPCEVGWPCRALVDGGILRVSCQYNKPDYSLFKFVNNLYHLKKGVGGVVGRALSSRKMVFCRDVTQLSLTEYPLAHYARKDGLSGCFAICLQSSCTRNDVYVLEFFMPVSNETNENPHTLLRKILETMKKDFRTLRVASGEELGEELYIEEIGIQNGERLDPVQMLQTTISLARPELSQSVIAVMQGDSSYSSYQQSVNTINTGSNVGGTERNDIAITCTQEKGTVKASKRKGNKSGGTVKASTRKGNKSGGTVKKSTRKGDKSGGTVKSSDREDNKKGVKIEISLEEILQTSEVKLEDAAQSLGDSKSTLKRVCRDYCIERSPPHKKNKVVCSQLNESAPCVDLEQSSQLNLDDLPFAQPSATIVHTEPHDATMQDANVVTIKAKYAEGNAIKFRLSLSSRLIELQQEVAQRLNLEAGTYSVKYKDEDGDLILIGCDEDLQGYMCTSRLEGKTCIVVLLEPK